MHVRELEDILGAPARLAVMATAMDGQRWTFTALGRETGLADGNLHVQTRKLTAARLLARERVNQGNRTVTCFEITEKGRRVFQEYVRRLRESAEQGTALPGERVRTHRPGDASQVW